MALKNLNVPTVSTDGWVNDDGTKAYRLLEYFLISDYSQSNMYLGNITSLKYIMGETLGLPPDRIADTIKEALVGMYDRYFKEFEIFVSLGALGEEHYEASVSIKILDDRSRVRDVGKNFEIRNGSTVSLDERMTALQDVTT